MAKAPASPFRPALRIPILSPVSISSKVGVFFEIGGLNLLSFYGYC
jgi:hypothetical protein